MVLIIHLVIQEWLLIKLNLKHLLEIKNLRVWSNLMQIQKKKIKIMKMQNLKKITNKTANATVQKVLKVPELIELLLKFNSSFVIFTFIKFPKSQNCD